MGLPEHFGRRQDNSDLAIILQSVREKLQCRLDDGVAHAFDILRDWNSTVSAVSATDMATVPGKLRKKLAMQLDSAGFDRHRKVECAVLLDAVLRQVAEAYPELISKQTGTLGGLPKATPASSQVKRMPPQFLQGGEAKNIHGASGFFVTITSQRGKEQNAVQEFLALCRKQSIPFTLNAVRCSNGLLFVADRRHDGHDVLEAARQMSQLSVGDNFLRHCERIWPLQIICADTLDSLSAAVRTSPILAESVAPTTFAIQNAGGAFRGGDIGCDASLAKLADSVPDCHDVDLCQPAVVVQLRGFGIGDERWCGVCVARAEEIMCVRSSRQFTQASSGYAYYNQDVNSSNFIDMAHSAPSPHKTLPSDDELDVWLVRLREALSQADPGNDWFRAGYSMRTHDFSRNEAVSKTAKARLKRNARLEQARALVESFAVANLLDEVTATIEFGAGRGELTDHVRKHAAQCKREDSSTDDHNAGRPLVSILVDRDKNLPTWNRRKDCWSTSEHVHCVRVDIRNLWLPGVSQLAGHKVFGIGKHVCGAGTDLALRCLCGVNTQGPQSSVDAHQVVGVGIALCCRHACTWDDYVDPAWIQEAGFSPMDFGALAHMSSWAHQADERRQQIGWACKRFLDAGRVRFLRRQGFHAIIQDYVETDCTKENQVLLAWKDNPQS